MTAILQHVFICAALMGCYGHYTTAVSVVPHIEEVPLQAVFMYGRFRKGVQIGSTR